MNAAMAPKKHPAQYVRFAPFATRSRRGWVRDARERDLGIIGYALPMS
jgi:hypothetical protein